MEILLARHTETNYNVLGLSNADPTVDVSLTQHGTKQAELLALRLETIPFEVIIVSELKRTKQTADIINRAHSVPILIDGRLNDIRMGFEGELVALYDEARSRKPDIWKAKFNDGESLDELQEKVDSFLHYLQGQKMTYTKVLIVSHLTVLQLIVSRIKNIPKQSALDIDIVQGGFIKLEL